MKRLLLLLLLASCGSDETIIATIPKKGSAGDQPEAISCGKTGDCPEKSWCSIDDAGAGTCKPCIKGEPSCDPVMSW